MSKRKADHIETDSVLSSDGSKETRIADIEFHNKVFLRISLDKSGDGTISAKISDDRFDTIYGSKQEDHVVPYVMFLKAVARKLDGAKVTEGCEILYATFMSIYPDEEWREKWPKPEKIIRKSITEEQRMMIEEAGLDPETYKKGLRSERVDAMEDYAKRFVEYYSKIPDVVHKKTGKKGANEGTETAASLASLNAINEFLVLKERLSANPDDAKEEKINFAKRALAANGDLVNGMRKLGLTDSGVKSNITKVRRKYGLPGNVKGDDERFSSAVCEKIFRDMEGKESDYKLIGGLIETSFDFPRDQCPKDQKRRDEDNVKATQDQKLHHEDNVKATQDQKLHHEDNVKATQDPKLHHEDNVKATQDQKLHHEDNVKGIKDLIRAASQCLCTTFSAFPELNKLKEGIAREFLDKVIEKQGWDKDMNVNLIINSEVFKAKIAPKKNARR